MIKKNQIYLLQTDQLLAIPLSEAWEFFTSPGNLSKITPPDMDFKIISELDGSPVYTGMEITYTVKPMLGIPVKWKTLISEVVEGQQFTDRQLEGPYKLWEHTHTFTATDHGLLMTDTVRYELPFGIIGKFAHWLFVRRKLKNIFTYRRVVVEKLFNQNGILAN